MVSLDLIFTNTQKNEKNGVKYRVAAQLKRERSEYLALAVPLCKVDKAGVGEDGYHH